MKTDRLLVLIQDDNIVSDLRELHCVLVYPLKSFSVGFVKYYLESDIPKDSFIFVNKALDSNDCIRLEKILNNYQFRGIIFDDIGIIEILKKFDIEKILYQPHQLTNYESINYMLEYVDSILLSTDLTYTEINKILDKSNKKLCIFSFGYVNIMYSKRTLLTNYSDYYQIEFKDNIYISTNNKKFIVIESNDGTVLYDTPCVKNLNYINHTKVKYSFINTVFLDNESIKNLITTGQTDMNSYSGFLNTKTVYKLKGGDL